LCDVSRSTSEGGLTRCREACRVSALRNPPDEESTNERGASGSEAAVSKRAERARKGGRRPTLATKTLGGQGASGLGRDRGVGMFDLWHSP
jgi:hypothetical protein